MLISQCVQIWFGKQEDDEKSDAELNEIYRWEQEILNHIRQSDIAIGFCETEQFVKVFLEEPVFNELTKKYEISCKDGIIQFPIPIFDLTRGKKEL